MWVADLQSQTVLLVRGEDGVVEPLRIVVFIVGLKFTL